MKFILLSIAINPKKYFSQIATRICPVYDYALDINPNVLLVSISSLLFGIC
jgi:hypothetical protein